MNSELNFKYDKANIDLRRNKTLELLAKGYQQQEISQILGVSTATTSLDCQYLRCKAQDQMEHHLSQEIPYHYMLAHEGLTNVLRAANRIVDANTTDDRTRIQALILISNTCVKMMELDTNMPVLGAAVSTAKAFETSKFMLKEMAENSAPSEEEEDGEEGSEEE